MNILVTITYNAMKDHILEPFFACVRAQKDQDFVLLVIDNASTDGTPAHLRSLDIPNLHVILNEENIGFGRACNQGIAFAREQRADYVTFLNNDTEFDENLLGDMVTSLAATDAVGLSPLITFFDDPGKIWFITGSYRWNRGMIPYHDWIGHPRTDAPAGRMLATEFAPGCCLIFRMAVFDVIPGFDDRYFVYWEDSDFCMTLRQQGLHIVVDTALECRHKVSVSTGGAFSDFSIAHFNRGHVLFVRKHFGVIALAYTVPITVVKTALNVVRRRIRPRQLPVWFRGVVSGLRD